jgi:hypothetical protein
VFRNYDLIKNLSKQTEEYNRKTAVSLYSHRSSVLLNSASVSPQPASGGKSTGQISLKKRLSVHYVQEIKRNNDDSANSNQPGERRLSLERIPEENKMVSSSSNRPTVSTGESTDGGTNNLITQATLRLPEFASNSSPAKTETSLSSPNGNLQKKHPSFNAMAKQTSKVTPRTSFSGADGESARFSTPRRSISGRLSLKSDSSRLTKLKSNVSLVEEELKSIFILKKPTFFLK